MQLPRSSGILLHPTSFPGQYGIGDLGREAYRFIEYLISAGQQVWQVLPLGPTGYGDSPYATFSSFAGNPYLISLEWLDGEGELPAGVLAHAPAFPHERVDYGWLIPWKMEVLRRSYHHFIHHARPERRVAFEEFVIEQQDWLNDFALFMALKDAHGGAVWNTWEPELARHEPEALGKARITLAEQIRFYQYIQFQFFTQWFALKRYANEKGITIIGDMPIFVAYDSADTWANPDLFWLDDAGKPVVVAGVPPDYFSATGQLWGNPLYRWEVLANRGYAWWIKRLSATLAMVDIVRLDHFRGFEAYWAVPAGADTAVNGEWLPGPGADLFNAVKQALGDLPIIAEDLGIITPPVEELRDSFGFPGMRVLQFAFSGNPADVALPHNFVPNCVVYTGTHDNDTTRGWFEHAPKLERAVVRQYLGDDDGEINWRLIKAAWSSVARLAVVPLQDILGLGSEGRMNLPGSLGNNWSWRYSEGQLSLERAERLRKLTLLYNRVPDEQPAT